MACGVIYYNFGRLPFPIASLVSRPVLCADAVWKERGCRVVDGARASTAACATRVGEATSSVSVGKVSPVRDVVTESVPAPVTRVSTTPAADREHAATAAADDRHVELVDVGSTRLPIVKMPVSVSIVD